MRRMKAMMELKLKKKQKEDKGSVEDLKGAMEDCSLRNEEAACADVNGQKTSINKGDAYDDVNGQKTSIDSSSMLTFSRQKLALIQCEYDPKCCSHCNKTAIDTLSGELNTCSKCKTAKYCSRDCQGKDWQEKHRAHCREIIRLKTAIEQDEAGVSRPISPGDAYLHAQPQGTPWRIDTNIEFYNMCIHRGKMFPMGFNVKTFNRVVCMYDAITGVNEGVVCRMAAQETVVGLCAVEVSESRRYLVVTHAEDEFKAWRMDFWAYPELATAPAYTFRAKPYAIGVIHFSDAHLLVVNALRQEVEEFDVTSFPVKRTGKRIPTGLVPWTNQIRNMWVMRTRQQQEKHILLNYFINDNIESALKCVDFSGHQLWEVRGQSLGGISFQPEDACADEEGHVFTVDSRGNRVVVIKPDLSLQVLVTTPGVVTSLTRCDVTGTLYVSHRNEGADFQAVVSRYSVEK